MEQACPWVQVHTWTELVASCRSFSYNNLLYFCLDFSLRLSKLFLGLFYDFLQDCDRESASNTAMAGYSLTGSVASSYLGHQRLEVKKTFSKALKHFILFRLEQIFTQERSFLFPAKDLVRLFPSGWFSWGCRSSPEIIPSFSVKNQQQSR